MKKYKFLNILVITLVSWWVFICSACNKDSEVVCENLFSKGDADSSLLIADWELKYFANTRNGKRVSKKEKTDISVNLSITTDSLQLKGHSRIVNDINVNFEFQKDNYLNLTAGPITDVYHNELSELEEKYISLLNNTICYVVNEKNLYIHTNNSNNNLLVFKRL